jgi:hypothetical protein
MVVDELLHALFELEIAGTRLVDELPALRLGIHLHRGGEDPINRLSCRLHGAKTPLAACYQCVKRG